MDKAFKTLFAPLPKCLKMIFAIFLAIPFVSIPFVLSDSHSNGIGSAYWLILTLLTYGVVPFFLCFTILIKHYLFLPAYILQVVVLIIHCSIYDHHSQGDIQMLHFFIFGWMAYIGIHLANKDFLAPFLTKHHRYWRRAFRFPLHLEISLLSEQDKGEKLPAVMDNCSATGIGIVIERDHLPPILQEAPRKQKILVEIQWGGQTHILPFEVMWSNEDGLLQEIGLHALDTDSMFDFVAAVVPSKDRVNSSFVSNGFALEYQLHGNALVLWVCFIVCAFGMSFLSL